MSNKILILTGHFYPDNSADSYLLTMLAEDLVSRGLEVNVLCAIPNYQTDIKVNKHAKKGKIYIERIWFPRFSRSNILLRGIDNLILFFIFLLHSLKYEDHLILSVTMPFLLPFVPYSLHLLRRQKYIIINYEVMPDIAAGAGVISKSNFLYRLFDFSIRFVLNNATAVIAIGHDMVKVLNSKGIVNNIINITNFSDSRQFFPLEKNQNPLIKKYNLTKKFVVLYSGNIGRSIDLREVIKAAIALKEQKEIVLLFVGYGVNVPILKKLIHNNRLQNIIYLPFQDYTVLNYSLNLSDIILVLTKKSCTGYIVSSKLYNAMAVGKPILSIVGQDSEVALTIKNAKCGYNLENGDDLAKNIINLYNDKAYCRELGRNSRDYFLEHFDRKIIIKKYYELIRRFI